MDDVGVQWSGRVGRSSPLNLAVAGRDGLHGPLLRLRHDWPEREAREPAGLASVRNSTMLHHHLRHDSLAV